MWARKDLGTILATLERYLNSFADSFNSWELKSTIPDIPGLHGNAAEEF
jgi:hypothetical protein